MLIAAATRVVVSLNRLTFKINHGFNFEYLIVHIKIKPNAADGLAVFLKENRYRFMLAQLRTDDVLIPDASLQREDSICWNIIEILRKTTREMG